MQWLRDRATEQAGNGSGPLKIMYRVDGTLGPHRGDPRPLRGLARLAAGAHRQRRRRPAAARHLRRVHGRHLARRRPHRGDGPPGLAVGRQHHRLAVRPLGPAGRGHLGDPRRPEELHLRPVPVLGRPRPRDPDRRAPRQAGQPGQVDRRARQDLQPDHGARLEPQARRVHPALRHRGAGLLAADDAADGLHRPARPDVAVHAGGDGPRAGLRQPGLPVQPQPPHRTAWPATRARSRCARSGTSTRWPGRAGSTTPG